MKKIIYLFILAIGVTSCSVESVDSTENLLTADAKFKFTASEVVEPISEWIYNNGNKDQGKVTVSNDCNSVTLSFESFGGDMEVEFNIFNSLPALNNGENFANSVITFDETDLDENNSYTILFSDLNNVTFSETLIVYAKAFGKDAGSGVHGKTNYFTYLVQELVCDEIKCESGYMIGDKNFNEIGTSQNWGWAHEFTFGDSGSETKEIHQKNGSLDGTVTISFDNGVISVEEGEGVTISHLYVSDTEPTETNAPGQFDKEQIFEDEDGTFWVMVKAEVCK